MADIGTPTLAIVTSMAAVTYLLRAAPLLGTGTQRMPRFVIEFLRAVAPAMLGALAAASVALLVRDDLSGGRVASFHLGIEWLAVLVCIGLVAVRRSLVLGLLAAVSVAALGRLV